MAARAARYVFFGLGICLTAAVCLYILRYALLTQIVVHYFEARGLPKPRLQVTELNTRRITLEHLALGAAGEFSAAALRIEFSAASLRARRLHRVSIEDATLHLDLSGEEPVLGTLQPLLGGGEGGAIPIETVVISSSRLLLATPHGRVQAMLAGTLTPLHNGALDARLHATVASEYGNTSASLRGVIAEDGTVSADVRLLDGLVILKEAELSGLEGTAKILLKEGAPPQINAKLALARVKFADGDFDRATITLATAADDLSLDLDVGGPTGYVRLEGRARIADYLGEAITDVSFAVAMDARADLFSWLGLPQPERGTLSLRAQAEGSLGGTIAAVRDGVFARDDWRDVVAEAEVSIVAEGLAYPARVAQLSARLDAAVRLAGGTLELTALRDAHVAATAVAPDWLRSLGVPDAAIQVSTDKVTLSILADSDVVARGAIAVVPRLDTFSLAAPLRLALSAHITAALELSVQGSIADPWRSEVSLANIRVDADSLDLAPIGPARVTLKGELHGPAERMAGVLDASIEVDAIDVAGATFARARLKLPCAVKLEPGRATLSLRAPGAVAAASVRYGDDFHGDGLYAQIPRAELNLATTAQTLRVAHDLTLDVQLLALSLARAEARALALEVTPGRVHITGEFGGATPYAPRTIAEQARVSLPQHGIDAAGISVEINAGALPNEPLLRFDVDALRRAVEATETVPVELRGVVYQGATGFELVAQAAAGGSALFEFTARYSGGADADATVDVSVGPLMFDPSGLQPRDLLPELGDVRDVRGQIGGAGTIAWGPQGVTGEARLRASDLAFSALGTAFDDVHLDLALDQLGPPASAAGQRLTVARIDTGVPIENAEVVFQILAGPRPRLAIERGEMRISGGVVAIRDALIDPEAASQDVRVDVTDLDLAELFSIIGLEDLTGDGRLSGVFPLRVIGDAVAIEGGRLDATGPGVLRFRSERTSEIFAGTGEGVDLLLRVLADFRYAELALTLDKPVNDEFRITLTTLGHNPKVLEAHPFQLNLALEGHADKLLALIGEVYGVSNQLLRRAWMFGR